VHNETKHILNALICSSKFSRPSPWLGIHLAIYNMLLPPVLMRIYLSFPTLLPQAMHDHNQLRSTSDACSYEQLAIPSRIPWLFSVAPLPWLSQRVITVFSREQLTVLALLFFPYSQPLLCDAACAHPMQHAVGVRSGEQ